MDNDIVNYKHIVIWEKPVIMCPNIPEIFKKEVDMSQLNASRTMTEKSERDS